MLDETSEWEGYPSILDGVRGAHAYFLGNDQGVIQVVVKGEGTQAFAYAITATARLFFVVDEFEYNVSSLGTPLGQFDPARTNYLQKAIRSNLLEVYRESPVPEMLPGAMHFAIVSDQDCVEFVSQHGPTILPLKTRADLAAWVTDIGRRISTSFNELYC